MKCVSCIAVCAALLALSGLDVSAAESHMQSPSLPRLTPLDMSRKSSSRVPTDGGKPQLGMQKFKGGSSGTASLSGSVFNLVKGVVGAGVLALPAGMAAFTDQQIALLPALLIMAFLCSLSGYGFFNIGRMCEANNAATFREGWANAVSEGTAWVPMTACTLMTISACLAYSMIIGDSFSDIFTSFGLPAVATSRTNIILVFTGLLILPLCLLKNLSALAPTSILGVGGLFYTAAFMAIRLFGGSYSPGKPLVADLAEGSMPSFGTKSAALLGLNPMVFVLVSMLATAFMAHWNAPRFLQELAVPPAAPGVSTKDAKIGQFKKLVGIAYGLCFALCATLMTLGFCTFGGNSQGLILNNYSSKDVLATLSRILIGVSIVCTYPLAFTGLRDSVFDLVLSGPPSDQTRLIATVAMLGGITAAALVLKDLGLVVSLGGALLGSFIAYIVPAIMFVKTTNRQIAAGEAKASMELLVNKLVIGFGVIMAGVGVTTCLMTA